MELGQFSISLNVEDIQASKDFYEALGFTPLPNAGSVDDKWPNTDTLLVASL